MAVGLLESSPVFARWIEECERALSGFVDWSLTDVLRAEAGVGWFERVDVVQPVLWAVMVALAETWRAAGVAPAAVVGHSQGEIAAAVVAGGLSVQDGARVVALRSRAIAEVLAGQGGMVSLALSCSDAEELIASWGGEISVAAVNGPTATVVSGSAGALEHLLASCEQGGIRARRIPVDYASHSHHVEQIEQRLLTDLAPLAPRPTDTPYYSAVTAEPIDTSALDARYWYENLRRTVRFEDTARALLEAGLTTFIEVSAHPVLTMGLEEIVDDTGRAATVLATLRRGHGDQRQWLTALAQAHVQGLPVDWTTVLAPYRGRPVDLPTYPF
ncbi:acyltransferase domain-containing protein, partial [Streptomyces alboverticillatus]|uniref:acyltransferase domain-containing protein n=1 Tax=Streptomyces alboverticillatus TaxID=173770 RepID=UPI003183EC28